MWLGVDWGTNSSKWFCNYGPEPLVGKIHSSNLQRNAGNLVFSPIQAEPGGFRIISLKAKLIVDPLGHDFWHSVRPDTETSLGAATAFSLTTLLNDSTERICQHYQCSALPQPIEIGFALPNWVNDDDEEARAPFKNFHQAVMVAVMLWRRSTFSNSPSPGMPFAINKLNQAVNDAIGELRSNADFDPNPPLGPSQLMQKRYVFENVGWRYIGESCAAGLPYLRSSRVLEERGLPGLRKLLVIDVGAGSTDVGYMIKTLERGSERELLHYFPQAGTLDVAGNKLTGHLRGYYRQQGRVIPFDEAESEKISSGAWHGLPFARSWMREIAEHVQNYIQSVPDKTRLPTNPGLQIILTGGSSVVTGLAEMILTSVNEVLPSQVRGATRLTSAAMLDIQIGDEVTTARRAVSIGAADSDIPALTYLPKL